MIIIPDPYWNSQTKIGTVSRYDQNEATTVIDQRYDVSDPDKYHLLFNKSFKDYREKMFKTLARDNMHFCSVVWDEKTEDLIAGVTSSIDQYTHLYYGLTKTSGEIMYSNDKEILTYFCDNVKEMAENTYMVNGETFSLDGQLLDSGQMPIIKKTRENADFLCIVPGIYVIFIFLLLKSTIIPRNFQEKC